MNHTHLPVTVKTRLGFDKSTMNAVELGKAAQSLGLRWMCVHGRTREQQYSGQADYAAIARVREQLSIPVLANGDVFAPEDAKRILRETGCSGLMIGRGAMGDPWLFRGAREALDGRPSRRLRPGSASIRLCSIWNGWWATKAPGRACWKCASIWATTSAACAGPRPCGGS